MPEQTHKSFSVSSGGNRAEADVDKKVRDRFFPQLRSGVLVEIGAARPDYLSISALFRSLDWQIVAIEPNPAYKSLYDERGFEVLQYACGDRDEDDVPFSVVNSHGADYHGGGVSFESFSSLGVKDSYCGGRNLDITPIKVKLRRLDTILAVHAPNVVRVDIVCADVEGWELEALSGFSFERYDPQVLIIENLFHEARYRTFMKTRGYILWRRLGPNDVYAKEPLFRTGEVLLASIRNMPKTLVGRARGNMRSLLKLLEKAGKSSEQQS